eukprot:1138237-Pelagomonas_calceolata.AAC.8
MGRAINSQGKRKALTTLRAQFQHLFSSAPPSSATRLRDFMNQADVLGLAKHISASAKLPP